MLSAHLFPPRKAVLCGNNLFTVMIGYSGAPVSHSRSLRPGEKCTFSVQVDFSSVLVEYYDSYVIWA